MPDHPTVAKPSIAHETLRSLGPLHVPPLGVGVWAWGDRSLWGYGQGYGQADVEGAYRTSIAAGIGLFDSAEIYGLGESERLLGSFARTIGGNALVATKFAPLPWRLSPRALRAALDGSLRRLGLNRIDLYQVHWPYTLLSIEALMDALADTVAEGLVRAVGVSNYSAEQVRRAQHALARRGVQLASNQVQYSLLWREPEANGVLETCRALGVTLIAYSPLALGLLTGKYSPTSPPGGLRRLARRFSAAQMQAAQPVIALLREIGQGHAGKTPAQVALNWLARQEAVLPIPGAKNARQAADNAGALGWRLSDDEAAQIDRATLAWKGRG
jgi:aryl-alcohol dehydrogenase-like predicted oxidoreductase